MFLKLLLLCYLVLYYLKLYNTLLKYLMYISFNYLLLYFILCIFYRIMLFFLLFGPINHIFFFYRILIISDLFALSHINHFRAYDFFIFFYFYFFGFSFQYMLQSFRIFKIHYHYLHHIYLNFIEKILIFIQSYLIKFVKYHRNS